MRRGLGGSGMVVVAAACRTQKSGQGRRPRGQGVVGRPFSEAIAAIIWSQDRVATG